MTGTQICKTCGRALPLTRAYFGNTPSGGFRRKCRQCMAAYTAAHKAANPNQTAMRRTMRQAREAAAGPKCNPEQLSALRRSQNDRCGYCFEPLHDGGQVDHMIPVAKGGTNNMENIVLACEQCNKEKHAKTADEYFKWRREHGLPNYESAYAHKALYGIRKRTP